MLSLIYLYYHLDRMYCSNSQYSTPPLLSLSNILKNGQTYFLSTEIFNLAIMLVTSSIVKWPVQFKSKSEWIFLSNFGSFLASSRTLALTSFKRSCTVDWAAGSLSFSGHYQVDSIILTKYSSLGTDMDRSVQQSTNSSNVTTPSLLPLAPSKLLRNSERIYSFVFLCSMNSGCMDTSQTPTIEVTKELEFTDITDRDLSRTISVEHFESFYNHILASLSEFLSIVRYRLLK